MRQIDDSQVSVRTCGVTARGRQILPPRAPGWHELLYATRGVLTLQSSKGIWVVPPHRAVWVTDGVPYELEVSSLVELRCLYFQSDLWPSIWSGASGRDCFVINVSPLLRELVRKAIRIGALESRDPKHQRLAEVIADELVQCDAEPLQLPNPADPRALSLIQTLNADLMACTLEQAILQGGNSRRTLERIFREETGMSLGQWVRRYRILQGLRMLAAGESVDTVSIRLGYGSSSAFIAMFRKELGTTPGRYFGVG